MSICHTLTCIQPGCGKSFHATYDDDEDIPELCPEHRPCDSSPSSSKSLDPMSHLGTPGDHHLRDWDKGWSDY